MNRLMLMYGIVTVVIISVAVVMFNFFSSSGENFTRERNELPPRPDRVVVSENREVQEVEDKTIKEVTRLHSLKEVTRLHSLLNQTVGWNGYRNIRWEDDELFTKMLDKVSVLKESTSDESLLVDFRNLLASIEIAIEEKDSKGLIYAHRIIHDLDYFVNGVNTDGVIYNVTNFGKDSKIQEVVNYITD